MGDPVPEGGCRRVTSALLKQRPAGDPKSIVLDDELKEAGRTAESIVNPHYPGQLLIRFRASDVTDLGLKVLRTLDVAGLEPAHGDLVGSFQEGGHKALIEASEWELRPPDACERPSGK
jgi:hypothetical protein